MLPVVAAAMAAWAAVYVTLGESKPEIWLVPVAAAAAAAAGMATVTGRPRVHAAPA